MAIDVVKLYIYDVNQRILVLRRSGTHPSLALHYDLPGGIVDENESFLDAALRELKEETGIVLSSEEVKHEHLEQGRFGGARALYSARLYEAQPEVTISWEHDQYEWMSIDEFISLPEPSGSDHLLYLTKQYLSGFL